MNGKSVLTSIKAVAGTALFGVLLVVASSAYAATPTLSLSSAGGSSVTVNVSGDANSNVTLYYDVGGSSGTQSMVLGTTNSSGYLSTVVNSYNVTSGQDVYVIVDGQQSSEDSWPVPSGTPLLNQSNVTLGLGQSVSVYSQGSSAPIYLASNSNSGAASVQVSGTQVTIAAEQLGSASVSLCYTGTANNCATLNITVQSQSVVTFSQNNLSLGVGQGSTVTISGGNGTYSITGNSNPSVASAVLSGSTITVSALAVGTTNVTACDSSGNCGTLYITVTTSASNGTLYFSMTNPSLSVGQTDNVTVSGGSSYYVTGNSNPSIASETLNGDSLTISGEESGATSITVCSASNGCGVLSVNVGSAGTTEVSFGIQSPVLSVGQNISIALSGGSDFYVSSNVNTGIAQATVNGASLALYAAGIGSDSVVVCATGGGCSTLYVTVSSNGQTTTTTPVTTTNTATTVTDTTTSNASLMTDIQSLQAQLAQIVTQIQSMTTTLTQLAGLASSSGGVTTTSGTTSTTSGTSLYDFTQFLSVGSQGADVTALQEYLTNKGFYTGPITGFYGTLTETAVGKYQTAHGITPAGYVGPSTRAALNSGE